MVGMSLYPYWALEGQNKQDEKKEKPETLLTADGIVE